MSVIIYPEPADDDRCEFPLLPRADDCEEIVVEVPVEEHLTPEQQKEVQDIDMIEGFLKEIAEIDACSVHPLQTTNKFLKDALVDSMKKAMVEKDKSKDKKSAVVFDKVTPESVDVALTRERILAREELSALRAEGLDAVVQRTHDADSRRDKIVDMRVKLYEQSKQAERDDDKNQPVVEHSVMREVASKPVKTAEKVLVVEKELDIAVFGSYKIKQKIGRGSHGVLYEAVADVTGRRVVLKTENEENGASLEERTKNSIGEAMINNEVDHANIMPIEGVVKDSEGRVYLVMPFIKDAKKAELTDKRTQKEITKIGHHFADALATANEKGIIHRDIKPDNTLIDPEGKPYLLDFGIATVDDKINPDLANSLTGTRFIDDKTAGSIRYMAPEVLEGWEKADAQSDVYSLGKMLYRMALQSNEAVPIGDVAEQLKEKGIEEQLARCITKSVADKAHRYKTAEEFANDLARILAGDTNEVKVPQQLEERVVETVVVPEKETVVSEAFESKIYRYMSCLSRKEFVMIAGQYVAFLNNVLVAFGAQLTVGTPEPMHVKISTPYGEKKVVITSLGELLSHYYGPWVLLYKCSELSQIFIPFKSNDKKISGSVMYKDGTFIGTIKTSHARNDTNLSKVLEHFSDKFGKKLWGSPAKELQKKGFTVDYATCVFKAREGFKCPSGSNTFFGGKPLYTVDNKHVGMLERLYTDQFTGKWVSPSSMYPGLVTMARFYQGRFFGTKKVGYACNSFIDLGDSFVLKPDALLTSWMK